jgi:hypothetical protein
MSRSTVERLPELTRDRVVPTTSPESFLTDSGNPGFRFAFLTKMSQQQKHSCQALFAGIEKLVNLRRIIRASKYRTNRTESEAKMRPAEFS